MSPYLSGVIATIPGGGSVLALSVGRAVKWANESRLGRLPSEPHERALAIIEERYALGDVDRDDYLERRGTPLTRQASSASALR